MTSAVFVRLTCVLGQLIATKPDRKKKSLERSHWEHKWFSRLAVVALILQSGLLFLALFEPGLPYMMSNPRSEPLNSDQFRRTLIALTNAQYGDSSSIDVLPNGENYYPAELAAISAAKSSVNLEAYIFVGGDVTKKFLAALEERARAGVKVRLVIDAIGSQSLREEDIHKLEQAGGKVAKYMALRWYTWPQLNHRTHREMLIVDGKIAFVGGSGWADHWLMPKGHDKQRWRDTMVRVEGPAVTGIQAAFTENWLESTGEVLTDRQAFPFEPGQGDSKALIVRSSPTTGRSTTARVLFQTLMASATKRIYITTPYFLPDKSMTDELARAVKERGVDVRIITPGPGTDHMLTRRSSRRLFGPLLEAGAHIYEYQPTMIHAKVLMIDSQWAVVGTTNMDPRSFSINDEVNLATPDPRVTQRLEQDFYNDLQSSREVNLQEWKHRGILERIHELFGGLISNQQ